MVVFQHYPLYRVSDAECTGEDAAPPNERYQLFHERYDVLSQDASKMVGDTYANSCHSISLFKMHTIYRFVDIDMKTDKMSLRTAVLNMTRSLFLSYSCCGGSSPALF